MCAYFCSMCRGFETITYILQCEQSIKEEEQLHIARDQALSSEIEVP